MSKSQKSNNYIRDWRPTGKQYAEAEKGVYESKNVAVIVALVFSLLANLLSIACLIIGGVDLGLLFVGLMAASDIVFIVLFSKVNFCCKYSAGLVALYLVLNVLFTTMSVLLGFSVIGDGSLFTVFGLILRAASVVVFTLVLLLSVRTARTSKRAVSFSVLLSVLLLGGLVYGQLFGGGYYGQNNSVLSGERSVVYALRTDDEGEEYYVAKSVLPGLGTKVIVEDTYLGKEVRSVTLNVLTAPRLKAVTLKGDRVMELCYPQEFPENLKFPNITVEKQLVEDYRQQAFFDVPSVLSTPLSAAYMPVLEEGEVAVRFQYDTAEIAQQLYNEENVLPVLVLKKGESVTLDDFTPLMQNYYTQENVLEWSYENAYRWNLLDLQANGEDLFEAVINKNTDVKVNFERVQKVRYNLTDGDYYTPENFDPVGYISPSAAEMETDYNHREGCQVTMVLENYDEFQDVESLRSIVFSQSYEGRDVLDAHLHYAMKEPSISQFFVSAGNSQANTFTYGDELKLEFAVAQHEAIVTYSLKEKYDGATEWNVLRALNGDGTTTEQVGVRTPGVLYYELVARADDVHGNPEMYAESTQIIQINVNKKTITGVWDLSQLPAQYDSLSHSASYSIDPAQAVTQDGAATADVLTFSTTNTEAKDAGAYTFTATLDDSLQDKYVLVGHTATHTVARKVVTVAWDQTTYVYDANDHVPSASWTLADGTPVTKAGDNAQMNANVNNTKYTAAVEIGDSNHIFESGERTSVQYTITPKALTMVDGDWVDLSFVFNNMQHTPTATVATGTADGTMALDVNNQSAKNAGTYTATASTKNTNYKLEGVTQKQFVIEKATAAVEWSSLSMVFNGDAQLPKATYLTFNTSGQQVTSATAKVVATAESINVDSYTANASHASTLDAQNYTLTNTTSGFDITKKTVSTIWGTTKFTYNGAEQVPTATYKNAKNQTVSLSVTGGQTDVGSYSAAVTFATALELQNYTLDDTSGGFEIAQKSVAAVWSTSTFTFDGTQKTLTASYQNALGETVALTVQNGTGTNANTYNAIASLTSSLEQRNYTLTNTKKDLIIRQKAVTVQWSALSVVYNGAEQKPTAQFEDVFGEMQPLTVNGSLTDVDSISVSVSTTDSNYTYSNTQVTFKVTPYIVETIEWIGETTYTFNDEVQGLTARYQNLTGGYTTAYTSTEKYAGTYTATAVTNNKNYEFAATAEVKKTFTIEKLDVTVQWSNTSFVYDPNAMQVPDATIIGLGGVTLPTNISGAQKDAGTYTASVTTANKNYNLLNPTCQFTIAKKQVSVAGWSNLSQTYTGAALKPTATCSQTSLTLVVEGSLTNVGTTTVTAKLSTADAKNYELTGETTATFRVLKKDITVNWSSLSFVYDGTEKKPTATYQGLTITVTVTAKTGSALTNGKAIEVGSYTATASTTNGNYNITNATRDFEINEPPVVDDEE